MRVRPIEEKDRPRLKDEWARRWGSPIMVSRGVVHHLEDLEGFVAVEDGEWLGVITYEVYTGSCEVVSLDSFRENRGVGSCLLRRVEEEAQRQG